MNVNDNKNGNSNNNSNNINNKPKDAIIGQKPADSKSNQISPQPEKKDASAMTPQEKELEMINNLKNDLRQHGKSFNKLKQDLIAYSRTTDNDLLR